jgi:hypothetical protein
MESATSTAATAKPSRGKPLVKGYDPRRIGSGRKPGVPQPKPTKAQRAQAAAIEKGAELAQQALDRMRAEFNAANPQELARFASTSAIRLLVDTVNDPKIDRTERLAAARTLVSTGWAQAPTQSLHLNANLDRMSDAALAKMLGMEPQAVAPRLNHAANDGRVVELGLGPVLVDQGEAQRGEAVGEIPTKGNPKQPRSIGERNAPSEQPLNGSARSPRNE